MDAAYRTTGRCALGLDLQIGRILLIRRVPLQELDRVAFAALLEGFVEAAERVHAILARVMAAAGGDGQPGESEAAPPGFGALRI